MAALVVDFKAAPQPVESARPTFSVPAPLGVRVVMAFAVCSVGLYYLASGKENASLQKMLIGTVLVFASLFLI